MRASSIHRHKLHIHRHRLKREILYSILKEFRKPLKLVLLIKCEVHIDKHLSDKFPPKMDYLVHDLS
jgi:hypothetical protein